jgi:hypothetical protein
MPVEYTPAGPPRRRLSTARIRAMFRDFVDHPETFNPELRQKLIAAVEQIFDALDSNPKLHEDVVVTYQTGEIVREISDFLSQGDTETRDE